MNKFQIVPVEWTDEMFQAYQDAAHAMDHPCEYHVDHVRLEAAYAASPDTVKDVSALLVEAADVIDDLLKLIGRDVAPDKAKEFVNRLRDLW